MHKKTWLLVFAALIAACDGSTGPRTGSLTVTINGLPSDIPAAVTVAAPEKGFFVVTATKTLADLEPGTYNITAANATSTRATFTPSAAAATVEVPAGTTPAQAAVSYTIITGIAALTINGAPPGSTPAVTLSNGTGVTRTVNASGEIGNLPPGSYAVTITDIDADEIYKGSANPATLVLSASINPVPVAVTYTVSTGSIRLSASGLPQGASATWDLAGPSGFTKTVTGTGNVVVSHLPPGQYTVTARNVAVGTETFGSSSGTQSVGVSAGQVSPLATAFVSRPSTLNLTIEGAYLTQSTQTISGAVPLVGGRDAYLRVFVRANETNSSTPRVRLRLFRGGEVISTQTISSTRTGVPTSLNEGAVAESWNVVINGSLLTPGISYIVDVDPDNTVSEVNESDNQFPADGSQKSVEVRTVPPVNLRFVPITTGDGVTGNVSQGRLAELTSMTSRMHPLGEMTVDLRGAYSTSLVLARSDSNNAWGKILGEIETLRVTEGSGRMYVGVLKDNIGSGVAGIGYIGGRSSVSYDAAAATETIAHELGHNWGRFHSPCGGPSGVDPAYPYAGGKIGSYGYDMATGSIMVPDAPDVMSYCWLNLPFNLSTPRRWISDYTYTGVMNRRQATGDVVLGSSVVDCLIVWGRVTKNGLVLEPAFFAKTRPSMPARSGRLSLRAKDANGSELMSLSFDAMPIADAGSDDGHFVFAIPASQVRADRLSSLTLAGGGFSPAVRASRSVDTNPEITTAVEKPGFVRVTWNAEKNPLLVVRDPQTNQVLSFARSGNVVIQAPSKSLSITASNGVKSIELRY